MYICIWVTHICLLRRRTTCWQHHLDVGATSSRRAGVDVTLLGRRLPHVPCLSTLSSGLRAQAQKEGMQRVGNVAPHLRNIPTPRRRRRDTAYASSAHMHIDRVYYRLDYVYKPIQKAHSMLATWHQRRRNVGADETRPKRQVPIFTLCMRIGAWTIYIGLLWRHTTCQQHRINSDETRRRRVWAAASLRRCLNVKLPHVSCSFTFPPGLRIYAYPGDTSTEVALVPANTQRRNNVVRTLYVCLGVLAIQNTLQFAFLVVHYNIHSGTRIQHCLVRLQTKPLSALRQWLNIQ